MQPGELTSILQRAGQAEPGALSELWQATYQEVHRMAIAAYARESDLPSLQPTALVSEVFLRLHSADSPPRFENRRHFFGAVARSLGQVLVDHARARAAAKRGNGERPIRLSISEHELAQADRLEVGELERLLVAIREVETAHPRAGEVIWLRFVTGLSESEVAGILGVSRRTIQSDWLFAKALLRKELGIEPTASPEH